MMPAVSWIPLWLSFAPWVGAQEPQEAPADAASLDNPLETPAPPAAEPVSDPDPVEHVEAPPGAPGGDPEAGGAGAEGSETAAAGTPGGEPVAVGAGRNFLVVLVDESGVHEGTALAFSVGVGDAAVTVTLRDDGEPPDVDAGDGRSAAAVTGTPAAAGPATLRTPDGEVLWTEPSFTIPPDMLQPSLRLEVIDGQVTGGLTVDEPAGPAPGSDGGPPASPFVSLVESLGLPIVLGLTSGILIGLLIPAWRRRRGSGDPELAARPAVTWPKGLALPAPGEGACWLAPDEAARTRLIAGVARHAAAAGPVLVLPTPGSRPALAAALAGLSPVLVPARDGATAVGLAASARQLGEGLVLVAGPRALEAPAPAEPHDAELDELIELSPLPVVLITLAGEATPVSVTATLQASGDSLTLGEQIVFDGTRIRPS